MNLKLTILVDNHAAERLKPEHGLSLLISINGQTILFDAGQHSALESNTKQLGISLKHIDAFVLSHGHYDHTGDVDFVLQENPEVSVYAHPDIFKQRYSIYPGKDPKDISMPPEERLLIGNLLDAQLNWVRTPKKIVNKVYLTGPIPRTHPLEDTGGPFFDDMAGQCPDLISDDMAMWIETPKGLLIICGCCHSGLINTLNYILANSSDQRIWAVIGGLHLKNASPERLAATAGILQQKAPEFIVPCHCTGDEAITYFKQNVPIPVHTGFAGFELKQEN